MKLLNVEKERIIMSCSYYESKGSWSWGGGDYYCHKKQDYINSDIYYKYCRSYSYDECPIYKGGSSSGGCYLTSACVYAKGLPDDCYELQTLRFFRDSWLNRTETGRNEIKKYYDIAPRIVSRINETDDKKNTYEMIYEKMVKPCVRFIEQKQYQETLELYRNMTLLLEEKYCL